MADQHIRDDDRPLEPGMMLLDPNKGRPQVWTVVSKRVIVAHYGSVHARAHLSASGLPKDWRVLTNEQVAAALTHDWREEAWQCYVASGADPDGADARHLNPGEAVAAVKELSEEYGRAINAVPLAADNTMRQPTRGVE